MPSSQKQGDPRLSQFGGHELPPTFNPAGSQDIQEEILKTKQNKKLGVSELENAIVDILAIIEELENSTLDAVQVLQKEVTSLQK